MFFHQYKYRIKYFLKTPTILFWALIFPMLLGTLFQVTFGSAMSRLESFHTIPVAVVAEADTEANKAFTTMLEEITYTNDDKMFELTFTDSNDALELLMGNKVDGIITLGEQRTLQASGSGINQSILRQFLNQYLRSEAYINDIMLNQPENLEKAISNLSTNLDFVQSTSLNGGDMNALNQYFYALIAMVCLFGCYLGLQNAIGIQANLSAIGARRCSATSKKMTLLCADSFAALTIHFSEIVIVYLYLRFILGVPIGEQPLYFFLTCFFGSLIGIFLGQFIGIVFKGSESAKDGILTSVSLIMSFLSGLMFSNMKDVVEKNAPFLNRINPAALITDCFYSLSVFNDMTRYYQSLISLIIISLIFLVASILLVRREKYESI